MYLNILEIFWRIVKNSPEMAHLAFANSLRQNLLAKPITECESHDM
jgi:hypothetical protein